MTVTPKQITLGYIRELGPCTYRGILDEVKDQCAGCDNWKDWDLAPVLNELLREDLIKLYDSCDAFVLTDKAYSEIYGVKVTP